jgi:hypothetical protein
MTLYHDIVQLMTACYHYYYQNRSSLFCYSNSLHYLGTLRGVKHLNKKYNSKRIEVLHDHVTAAMLDGRNNEIFLHENEFNSSGETDYIVLSPNMAAFT